MAEELQNDDVLESQGDVLESTPKVIEDVEWCFQFFTNEPQVFAYSSEGEPAGNLSIELKPLEGEGLSFSHNGMVFRIFPRPISEESKQIRAEENESKN